MAGVYDKWASGQRLYMDQQRNALAREKYDRALAREAQFENILAESYTQPQAAIPSMPAAPAMGPLPTGGAPLPDYPAQRSVTARPSEFDISGAERQLMGEGFLPEALQVRRMGPKAKTGFTLGESQVRFDPAGKEIARGPAKPVSQFMPETDPRAPWRKVLDPKKRDEARIRMGESDRGKVDKMITAGSTASLMANDIGRFLFLNEKTETGGQYGLWGAKGLTSAFDPEFAEMRSLSDKLTPAMRQGMPGAASDRDVAMFKSGTVGVERDYEANLNIGQGLKAAAQNKVDKAAFFDNYHNERGHTRGANEEWKNYLEANPIFDHEAGKGSYELNENRQTWQEYKQFGAMPSKAIPKQIGRFTVEIQ